MKKKLWTIFAVVISTSLLAQDASNTPPVMQAPPPELAPATTAPAIETQPAPKPAKKKTAARKPAFKELITVPLVPGPAVVSANHVNVRSKAGLVGEIITRMTNGTPVTVLEEIHLKKSGPEEPSAWAKILLPSDAHVWVKTSFIDAANKTVTPKKLNMRAGPGENYGVTGTLQRGDTVQEIQTKGEWTEIQAPTNAYAFMAAQYLKQEEAPAVAAVPEPAPTPATVTETPTMAAAPTEPPAVPEPAPPVIGEAPEPAPVVEEPPPPRIVQREGIVRSSFSIQAPTRFELISPDNHKGINYLYTSTTNLDLSRYKGLHIIVTGEEGLDERWKNTPVITIQRIQVLE